MINVKFSRFVFDCQISKKKKNQQGSLKKWILSFFKIILCFQLLKTIMLKKMKKIMIPMYVTNNALKF